jgi:hypothetical protein
MQTISWKHAFDIATNYQEQGKVTLIVFVDKECDVCGAFIKQLPQIENSDYQIFIVEDGRTMPFTLTSYPMGYVYIPNCPTEMPLQRIGGAPLEVLTIDSERQITAMKTGKDYYEVRDADRQARKQAAA